MELSAEQIQALDRLWFIFGNYGKKHTNGNHRFIQVLIEGGEDARAVFLPTDECKHAVDKVLGRGDDCD